MNNKLDNSDKLIISLNNLLKNINIKQLDNNKEKIKERAKYIKTKKSNSSQNKY